MEQDGVIRAWGRIYTFSRHYLDKPDGDKIATNAQIRYVMIEPSHFQQQGNRRAIYERFVPELGIKLRVVEDRLSTGEWQILTVYPVD